MNATSAEQSGSPDANPYSIEIIEALTGNPVTVDVRTLGHEALVTLRTEAAAVGDFSAVKTYSVVLGGLTEAAVQAMYAREDPETPHLFDYIGEVRAHVVDSLVADGSVVDDAEAEFDVDAIVDQVTLRGDISSRDVYWIAVSDDDYWAVVQRNAR